MKYYLLKQEDWKNPKNRDERILVDIVSVNNMTISRNFLMKDTLSGKVWWCFTYTPEAKLRYIRKEVRQDFLDRLDEDYSEVSMNDAIKFFEILIQNHENRNDFEHTKYYKNIIQKIKKLTKEYSE